MALLSCFPNYWCGNFALASSAKFGCFPMAYGLSFTVENPYQLFCTAFHGPL